MKDWITSRFEQDSHFLGCFNFEDEAVEEDENPPPRAPEIEELINDSWLPFHIGILLRPIGVFRPDNDDDSRLKSGVLRPLSKVGGEDVSLRNFILGLGNVIGALLIGVEVVIGGREWSRFRFKCCNEGFGGTGGREVPLRTGGDDLSLLELSRHRNSAFEKSSMGGI